MDNISNYRLDDDKTLFKVWKFKGIRPVKRSICGMCGMETFTLLDFTKEDTLTYEVNDRLVSVPIRLENKQIIFNSEERELYKQVRFRISKLTAQTLNLVLVVDFNDGETKIQGEMVELLYHAEGL